MFDRSQFLSPFSLGLQYFRFWIGQTLSAISDNAGGMALSIILLRRTGSATQVSVGLLLQMLPAILVGPVAGIILDRISRKRVMVVADCFRAALTIYLALSIRSDTFGLSEVYFWMGMNGILRAFYDPATMAVIPAIVGEDSVQQANAVHSLGKNTAMILGPAIGGVALKVLGDAGTLESVAAAFGITALLVASVRLKNAEFTPSKRPGLAEMWEGFRFYREVKLAMTLLLVVIFVNFCAAPSGLAFQVHVLNTLGSDSDTFGYAMSVSAVASIVVSFFLATKKRWSRLGAILLGGIVLMGVSFALTGLADSVRLVFLTLALFGAAGPMIIVPVSTLYQEITPSNVRGRVFAVRFTFATFLSPVSIPLAGWALDNMGSRFALLAIGGMMAIVASGTAMVRQLREV